jgi:hypothetical protein
MEATVDTGLLVAVFDRSERHHFLAADQVKELDADVQPSTGKPLYFTSRDTPFSIA